MSCAPFHLEEAKQRLPEFPGAAACVALDESPHPSCCCRRHQGRGWYVIGQCGHAHGWNLRHEDGEAQRLRLDRAHAAGAAVQAGFAGRDDIFPPDRLHPLLEDRAEAPVVEVPPPFRA